MWLVYHYSLVGKNVSGVSLLTGCRGSKERHTSCSGRRGERETNDGLILWENVADKFLPLNLRQNQTFPCHSGSVPVSIDITIVES